MMRKIALGIAAIAAFAAPASAATLFGVDGGNRLVTFNSNAPGTFTSTTAISGLNGAAVKAMDFRARDGRLYALADDNRLYIINRFTGAATAFSGILGLSGTEFALDFNPTNANLRIVSNNGSNYFYNFATNALVTQNPASYGGPPASGITGAGYINNFDGATSTVLFVLDATLNRLATLNVGTGALTDRGSLGVDFTSRASFDIDTVGSRNFGFGYSDGSLYSIDVSSAGVVSNRATLIGATPRDLFALTAAIPEPATWGLMILGFGFIGGAIRMKTRKRREDLALA